MRSLSLVILAAALVAPAAAAPRPSASLVSPRLVGIGASTQVVVTVRSTKARPVLRYALGPVTRSVRLDSAGLGRWQAFVTFPTEGAWRLSVALGKIVRPLGVVRAEYRVKEPFELAAEPGGTLLVADGGADRLLRLDPRTGNVTSASPKLEGRIIAVVRDAAGRVYVSLGEGAERVVLIEGETVRKVSDLPGVLGLAADGDVLIPVWAGTVYRVDSETHALTTFAGRGVEASDGDGGPATAAGLMHPHGVTSAPDGTVYVTDTYAGKIRRIDAAGIISTVASGLTRPVDVVVDADGTLLVSEAGGAVKRVGPGGSVRLVTDDVPGPTGLAVAPDGAIYAGGLDRPGVYRVDAASGRATKVTR